VASYAIVQQGKLLLRALVASADGRKVLRQEMTADIERADTLGTQVAQSLLDDGAAELLAGTGDA
jgi:hydroxymethylbilane synthase